MGPLLGHDDSPMLSVPSGAPGAAAGPATRARASLTAVAPADMALDPEVDLEKHEFPLFLYLLHFLPHQSKTGDIARAALVICLEVLPSPPFRPSAAAA